MTPYEFMYWLNKHRPDLIPDMFGNMVVSAETINLVGEKVGFRKILGCDSRSETLDDLKVWIETNPTATRKGAGV